MINFTSEFLTEKGNLRKPVMDDLRAQTAEQLVALGFEATPNGDYAKVLGSAEDGSQFYLTVGVTIGKVDPFVKHEKKVKEKAVAEVPAMPSIFG